jgi:hypothetical protein
VTEKERETRDERRERERCVAGFGRSRRVWKTGRGSFQYGEE